MTEVLTDGVDGRDGLDVIVREDPDDLLVHRNGPLFAGVTLLSTVVAAAYTWRGLQGSLLGWLVVAVLGAVALAHLRGWVDARKPLLVADPRGVRIRLGQSWTGFDWDEIDEVVVHPPRRHLLADGTVLVRPRVGEAYEVRVGVTSAASREDIGMALDALAAGRATVVAPEAPTRRPVDNQVRPAPPGVVVGPGGAAEPAADAVYPDPEVLAGYPQPGPDPEVVAAYPQPEPEDQAVAAPAARVPHGASPARPEALRRSHGRLAQIRAAHQRKPAGTVAPTASEPLQPAQALLEASAAAAVPDHDVPASAPEPPAVAAASVAPVAPGPRRAVRADVRRSGPFSVGSLALSRVHRGGAAELPEVTELRGTEGRVGLVIEHVAQPHAAEVTPYATAVTSTRSDGGAVTSDPVIGAQLAQTRIRLRVTVDQLAERTRIRPHVIEAMEVDDFEPCGGDFYARGHLRRLASVLAMDPEPLLDLYDTHYGQGPITASKVFSAELATGPNAAVRGTRGGPNWTALLGVVVALLVLWGVARFVTSGEPAVVEQRQPEAAASSAPEPDPDRFIGLGVASRAVSVTASQDTVVRLQDADGKTIWIGPLQAGESRRWSVTGEVTIRARNSGAVTAQLGTEDPVAVGRGDVPDEVTLGTG